MKDDLDERLRDIHADIPEPRTNLTEEEKDELIRRVGGPRTTASILKAAATLGKNRIPFIFNKRDPVAGIQSHDFLLNK